MTVLEITLTIGIVICILIIIGMMFDTKFQINIIRLNEAEANIFSVLRKRYDLLNKCIPIIKDNTEEVKPLENIKKSRSKKMDMFELNNELLIALAELKELINKYPDLKNIEQYKSIDIGISETENEATSFKKYYNDIATDYNKMVRRFPKNIVALVRGYKIKKLFEK